MLGLTLWVFAVWGDIPSVAVVVAALTSAVLTILFSIYRLSPRYLLEKIEEKRKAREKAREEEKILQATERVIQACNKEGIGRVVWLDP